MKSDSINSIHFKANYVDVINDNKGKGGKVTDEQKEAFGDFWDEWKWDPVEGRNKIIASFCPQVWHSSYSMTSGKFCQILRVPSVTPRYMECTRSNWPSPWRYVVE